MRRLKRLSPRRLAFIREFVACGGNASEAARRAGYARSSAQVVGSNLIRDDILLTAIVAEIARGAPGSDRALRRLLAPSRTVARRARVLMSLAACKSGTAPPVITAPGGRGVVVVDLSAIHARDHVARHARELGISTELALSVPVPGAKPAKRSNKPQKSAIR